MKERLYFWVWDTQDPRLAMTGSVVAAAARDHHRGYVDYIYISYILIVRNLSLPNLLIIYQILNILQVSELKEKIAKIKEKCTHAKL